MSWGDMHKVAVCRYFTAGVGGRGDTLVAVSGLLGRAATSARCSGTQGRLLTGRVVRLANDSRAGSRARGRWREIALHARTLSDSRGLSRKPFRGLCLRRGFESLPLRYSPHKSPACRDFRATPVPRGGEPIMRHIRRASGFARSGAEMNSRAGSRAPQPQYRARPVPRLASAPVTS